METKRRQHRTSADQGADTQPSQNLERLPGHLTVRRLVRLRCELSPLGNGPGREGATRNPGRAVPGQSKARRRRWRQLSGFTGAEASTRCKVVGHCVASCG